ncbi:MAG TPA: hypothetical protein ENN56_05135, partial [Firmicutes bacterium]|nr:hypothetical protein [Bacillota bacterium]
MNAIRGITGAIVSLAVAGCAYYSVTGGLPDHIKTVGVDTIVNETVESGVDEMLYRALGDKLVGRPQFRYASSRLADAVIRGTIRNVVDEPFVYSGDRVSEYQIVIVGEAVLYDRVRRRTVWSNNTLRGIGKYDATGGTIAREEAIN